MNVSTAKIIGISEGRERVCASAARISTQQGSALEIFSGAADPEKNNRLLTKVLKSGHNSVVEHLYFNIAFNNVSVVVEQFMIEFRLASFTVKSRRYVDFSHMGYYRPVLEDCQYKEIYEQTFVTAMDSQFRTYQILLERGIPKEDARFVLPYAYFTNFYCSMNARELLHVLEAMLRGRGKQYEEIYRLGKELYKQAKAIIPGMFDGFDEKSSKPCMYLEDLASPAVSAFEPFSDPVELLYAPEHAEAILAKSALIEVSQLPTTEIDEILKNKNLCCTVISRIMESERPRALESISYTFRFNSVSLAGITHFARHRMQSLLIPPLARTDRSKYIIPESITKDPDLMLIYKEAFYRNQVAYEELKTLGVSEELLVYFNLSGNTLDLVSTMNAREILLFLKLRTCSRAQWEIREHALSMLKLLRTSSLEIFRYYGPSCYVSGVCPEGKLSCGKTREMREFFSRL